MNRFFRLFVAELKELVRDYTALFWFVAFPILFILLFGAIFSGGGNQTFDVGIAIEAPGPLADGITAAFKNIDVFKVHTGDQAAELDALKMGKRSLVIVIPAEAGSLNPALGPATIPVYYDNGQQTTNTVLLSMADQILDGIERQITGRPRLLVSDRRPVVAKELRDIDFLLPGILAMGLMQLGLFGSMHLVSLRERKILKALGATPLPRTMLLGSEVMVRLLMSVVQTTLIIAIGRLVFNVHVIGPWYEVLGLVLLGAATFVSLGYFLSSVSKTEESGMGLVQLVQFPMMFLSGIFFPVTIMPAFLKPIVRAMPLTYLGDALRHVMVGMPLTYSMGTNLLVLVGIMAGSMLLAVLFWKWE